MFDWLFCLLVEGKAFNWLTQSTLDASLDMTVQTADSSLLFTVGSSKSKHSASTRPVPAAEARTSTASVTKDIRAGQ